jgi:hypothetical protein
MAFSFFLYMLPVYADDRGCTVLILLPVVCQGLNLPLVKEYSYHFKVGGVTPWGRVFFGLRGFIPYLLVIF